MTDKSGSKLESVGVLLSERAITEYTDADGVVYAKINDTDAAVIDFMGSGDSLVIPYKVTIGNTELTVTEIAESAFEGKTNLKSISLPNSIVVIRKRAFYGCSGLSTMTNHN